MGGLFVVLLTMICCAVNDDGGVASRHLSSYSASSLLLITPWQSKVMTVPMEYSEMQVKLISFRSVDSKFTMVVLLMVNFASAP